MNMGNANEIIFAKAQDINKSVILAYDMIGSITNCNNDTLGLKLDYLWIFNNFSVIFDIFIKIHDYAN